MRSSVTSRPASIGAPLFLCQEPAIGAHAWASQEMSVDKCCSSLFPAGAAADQQLKHWAKNLQKGPQAQEPSELLLVKAAKYRTHV